MSKKTFMTAIIISTFLLSLATGAQVTMRANANPLPPAWMNPYMTVNIQSPRYGTDNALPVLVSFTADSSWHFFLSDNQPHDWIDAFFYVLDGASMASSGIRFWGVQGPVGGGMSTAADHHFSGQAYLTNLTAGSHSITVYWGVLVNGSSEESLVYNTNWSSTSQFNVVSNITQPSLPTLTTSASPSLSPSPSPSPLVLWKKAYGGMEGDAVVPAVDGGYVIAGRSGDPIGAGYTNLTDVLIKTDNSGTMEWNKTYQNNPWDNILLVNASDGGFVVAEGAIVSFRTGTYLVKTDAEGNKQWDGIYQETGYYETTTSVIPTRDGGYVIAGGIYGDEWTSGKGYKAWVAKIDSSGNVQWQKAYDNLSSLNTTAEIHYRAESICETTDGNYVFTCSTNANASLLVKLDQTGNITWEKQYEGTNLTFNSVAKTDEGGYVLGGTINGSAYAAKVNSAGDYEWNKTYEKLDSFSSVLHSQDGGWVFTGGNYAAGSVTLFKTDSEGNTKWNTTYYGLRPSGEGSNLPIQDKDGAYVLTGGIATGNTISGIGLIKTTSDTLPQESSTPSPTKTSTPSPSIPEFPSFIFNPIIVSAMLVGTIIYMRKLKHKNDQKGCN